LEEAIPAKQKTRQNLDRMRRGSRSVTVPGTSTKLNLPDHAGLAWYAGLGAMATIELIEWPVALLIAGTHFIGNHAHNRDVQELAEGIDAGA
jgi:hypothetical protein